jgi:NAD(P)H-dependent nitrite reductase small subunit
MTSSARWTYVCRTDSIVPNTGVCAKVGRAQVAVFRICPPNSEEVVYAIDNVDPRSGASVLSRGLVGDLQGEIVVASPVYKQHYGLKTGRCIEDETLSVPTYPVRVFDGMVLVRESV